MKNLLQIFLRIILIASILASCVTQEKLGCPDFSKDKSMSYRTGKKYSDRYNRKMNLTLIIAQLRIRNKILTPDKISFPNIHELTLEPVPLTDLFKVSPAMIQDTDNTIKTDNNELTP